MHRRRTAALRKLRVRPLASALLLWYPALASAEPAASGADRAAPVPAATAHADALARVLSGAAPQGNTFVVQSCNDAGNGSLRSAVAAAQSGDTIDLTQLACARITLTTGQIAIGVDSLTLNGPGADQLSIDGGAASNHVNRVINHTGTGTLSINGLTVTNAKYRSSTMPVGGCIHSLGTVALSYSVVSNCVLQTLADGKRASGAGIASSTGVILVRSKISGNHAMSSSGNGGAIGGGIYTFGNLTIKYSTISDNSVTSGVQLEGGAVSFAEGNFYALASTISGNSSGSLYGGLYIFDYEGTHTARIVNSTISGNYSYSGVAGVFSNATTTIANSTIAFNTSSVGTHYAGMRFASSHGTTLTLQSTIIANNSSGGSDRDAEAYPASVAGAGNLIVQGFGPFPADTLTSCPLIGPLGNQGGETQTHRLLLGSPAVDAGNNLAASLSFDQRGSGFPRTHGARTDIGAFEDQGVRPNVIFIAGFEGRCR